MTYRKIAFLVSVIAIAVALVAMLPSADAADMLKCNCGSVTPSG